MNEPLLQALSAELGTLLASRGWRVTAAESCTGGLVAGAITAAPGSSAWFDASFVTYSNEAKARELGVPDALLAAHGAVSEPVARAMADGSLKRAGAHLSVAVTGIAGPGGGSPDKPVGTVCVAFALRGAPAASRTHRFTGDRAAIRQASVVAALEGLIELARIGARMPAE